MHKTAHGVPGAGAFAFFTEKDEGIKLRGVAGRQFLLESMLSAFSNAFRRLEGPWPLGNGENARILALDFDPILTQENNPESVYFGEIAPHLDPARILAPAVLRSMVRHYRNSETVGNGREA